MQKILDLSFFSNIEDLFCTIAKCAERVKGGPENLLEQTDTGEKTDEKLLGRDKGQR